MRADLPILTALAGLTLALLSMHPLVWFAWALVLTAVCLRFAVLGLRLL